MLLVIRLSWNSKYTLIVKKFWITNECLGVWTYIKQMDNTKMDTIGAVRTAEGKDAEKKTQLMDDLFDKRKTGRLVGNQNSKFET